MKALRVALLVVLVPTTSVFAAGTSFVPLKDYLAHPGIEKDPASLGYVMHRCSALYAVIAKNFEGEADPERKKTQANLIDAVGKFSVAAVQLMMRGTTMDAKEAQNRVVNITVDLGNLYGERIAAIRLRTNNMFDDALIASDYATCGAVLKGIQ